jgi:hypothetical protein
VGPNSDDLVSWLETWLDSHADGEWEHSHGLRIDTLDNPGWLITVDLSEEASVKPSAWERSDTDWLRATVNDGTLTVACGVRCLREALEFVRATISR